MSTCAICVEDTNYPVCCVPCGHVYCRECIDNWQNSKKSVSKCPECRERIEDVMAIFIKRDDSKDEVKELIEKIKDLQRILEDCTAIEKKLKNDLESHKESILNHKEEQKRSTSLLEEQRQQTAIYKARSYAYSRTNDHLQRENQRLLNIMYENEVKIEINNHLIECQREEIYKLENRWVMKMIKKTDKVNDYVSNFLTISGRTLVELIQLLFLVCLLIMPIIIFLNLSEIFEYSFSYEHLAFLMATLFFIIIVKSIYTRITCEQTILEQQGLSASRNISSDKLPSTSILNNYANRSKPFFFDTYYELPPVASIPCLELHTKRKRSKKT